jgi:NAD-dependent dihydropyrimidine dehydrogenase PreA subunit
MSTNQVAAAPLEALDASELAEVLARSLGRLDAGGLAEVGRGVLDRLAAADDTGDAARGLLDALHATVDRLGAQVLGGAVDDEALAASVVRLRRVETRVAAERLRRIGELDARKAFLGRAGSTADWLAPKLGLSRGQAKGEVDTAGALERLPQTAQRLRSGQLGVAQARQAARSLRELDRLGEQGIDVPAGAAEQVDAHTAAAPAGTTAGQLRRSLDEQLHADAPEALAQRERRAHARRRLWLGPPDPDGTRMLEARMDVLGGATLAAALDALSAKTGPGDDRSYAQRRHDALADLAQRALDAGELPEVAAQRPHVILTGPAATLNATDTDAGALVVDGYGPVSVDTARMVACDGEVCEVVVDDRGRPLKVTDNGRPTLRQRRAVIARDRSCIGCGAPASRCQVHHVVWQRHRGATVVGNLVLVCYACHHAIHHDGWTVTQQPPGRYRIRRTPNNPARTGRLRHTT